MSKILKQWLESFSGCDGGILSADTWLCGIEPGYARTMETDRKEYYECELPKEIAAGEVKLDTRYNFFTKESAKFPFNLAFAKMYAVIQNDKISNYSIRRKQILKLNLYPIAFKQDSQYLWAESLVEATGFSNKSEFTKFIDKSHRFSKIRRNQKPKLIVCIGNGYRRSFLSSFFGDETMQLNWERITPEAGGKKQNDRYIYHVKHDGTLLVVTPFSTSSNGLNSDYLIQKVGDKIKELLRDDTD